MQRLDRRLMIIEQDILNIKENIKEIKKILSNHFKHLSLAQLTISILTFITVIIAVLKVLL